MGEIKCGGGHHVCEKCGITVHGSKLHICNDTDLIYKLTADRDREKHLKELAVARFRAVERTLESVRVYGWKCGDTVNYYAEMQSAIAAYDAAVKTGGEI